MANHVDSCGEKRKLSFRYIVDYKKTTKELLQDLIRAKSPNPPGDVSACVDLISGILTQENIPFEIKEPKPGKKSVIAELVGRSGNSRSGKTLLFNGHLDTIPPNHDWDADPYDPIYKNGYIYGLGSVDMKAGIVASLMAILSIKHTRALSHGRILYTAVADEEFHGEFGTKYLIAEGLSADWGICCEPTDFQLQLGNRGLVMIDITVNGKSCHAGRPGLGVNAIHIAGKIIDAVGNIVSDRFHHEAFEIPTGSTSVVAIEGGARLNVVPDRCSLYIDKRLMPGETGEDAVGELARLIEEATGIKPGVGKHRTSPIVMHPEFWHEPFWTSEENSVVVSAKNCIERIRGRPSIISGKAAGTDASHLVSLAKIPSIIFGPGDFRLSHTSSEKVKLEDVLIATRIYEAISLELLNN